MMEPEQMQRAWKQTLDSLRDNKDLRVQEYRLGAQGVKQTGHAARYDRMCQAQKAYNDALSACIEGQDPVLWKLSYNGQD